MATELKLLKISKASSWRKKAGSETEGSRDRLGSVKKTRTHEDKLNATPVTGSHFNNTGGLWKKLTLFVTRLDAHLAPDLEQLKKKT